MRFFRKRVKKSKIKGKIFENLGKNVQNFEKGQPHACNYRMYETARICPADSFRCHYNLTWLKHFKVI